MQIHIKLFYCILLLLLFKYLNFFFQILQLCYMMILLAYICRVMFHNVLRQHPPYLVIHIEILHFFLKHQLSFLNTISPHLFLWVSSPWPFCIIFTSIFDCFTCCSSSSNILSCFILVISISKFTTLIIMISGDLCRALHHYDHVVLTLCQTTQISTNSVEICMSSANFTKLYNCSSELPSCFPRHVGLQFPII